jgi:hypothetical protein
MAMIKIIIAITLVIPLSLPIHLEDKIIVAIEQRSVT